MARIIIAGAGVSGLAAALVLARNGHQVTVLESRDDFTELGAGIQLGPNAFNALDRLGLGDEVRAHAVHVDALRLMDGVTEKPIAILPLGTGYRRRFGNPYAVVHRVDLYAPLLAACRREAAIKLRANATVDGYVGTAEDVTVRLAGGEVLVGDALIGADGINSAVRAQVVDDGAPKIVGHTIYRTVIPSDEVPEALRWSSVTLWAGPKWHVVHYPISGGKLLNLAAVVEDGATELVLGAAVDAATVLDSFPRRAGTVGRLLDLGVDWRSWVLRDRDPVRTWTDGRVVLIGDAAHPMLQYAAQGACQAIEDAVVLGDVVGARQDDFAAAFDEFTRRRRGRTSATQLSARRIGRQLFHPAGRLADARTALLATRTEEQLADTVNWLHGHHV
jgi:salicylate hydroxylase